MALNDIRKELMHINANLQSINKSLKSETECSKTDEFWAVDHPRIGDVYEIRHSDINVRFVITGVFENDGRIVRIIYDDFEVIEQRKWNELKSFSHYLFHRDISDLFGTSADSQK